MREWQAKDLEEAKSWYSDSYKDINGIRPRWNVTLEEINAFRARYWNSEPTVATREDGTTFEYYDFQDWYKEEQKEEERYWAFLDEQDKQMEEENLLAGQTHMQYAEYCREDFEEELVTADSQAPLGCLSELLVA